MPARERPATAPRLLVLVVVLAAVVLGCAATPGSSAQTRAPAGAGSSAPEGTGEASAGGLCGLFTPEELAPLLGGTPGPGQIAGPLGTACQWINPASKVDVLFQEVRPDDFEDADDVDGYRKLEGIGDYAYVAPHPLGRVAAALTADAAYIVLGDESADPDKLADLLKTFVQRSPGPAEFAIPSAVASALAQPPTANCVTTTDEVSAAVGREMYPNGTCAWQADDSTGLYLVVSVQEVPPDYLSDLQGTPVSGLGDQAFMGNLGVLYVRVGDRAFSVQVVGFGADMPDRDTVAKTLATTIVDHLR
jgi:hypothetical protein